MKRVVEVTLDPEEIKKLKDVSDINCSGIPCGECPYNIPDNDLESYPSRCFVSIVDRVISQGGGY